MWVRRLIGVGAALFFAMACVPPPRSQVQWGQTWQGQPLRVVLLPASCSSVAGDCSDDFVTGVSGLVASELEFARYAVSDAEKLVMSARTRQNVDVEIQRFGEQVLGIKSRVQAGSLFEDLSPAQRRALLAEANAQGILSIRVRIGTPQGGMRENEVQVRLGLGDGGELAWVSRCTATSTWNGNPTVPQALETAARCALDEVSKGRR